ncbi:MAG: hypothetical protein ACC628_08210, partial [Pirellulaceae bacterium]
KKVALMFPIARTHEGQFMRGVIDYVSEHGTWTFHANPEISAVSLKTLDGWPGHGVLAPLRTKAPLQAAKALEVPIVHMAGTLRYTGLPRVMVDQEAIGRLAAEHLKHDILVPPEGVVARRSTDTETVDNPHVAAAVRFIREHMDNDDLTPSSLGVIHEREAASGRNVEPPAARPSLCRHRRYVGFGDACFGG